MTVEEPGSSQQLLSSQIIQGVLDGLEQEETKLDLVPVEGEGEITIIEVSMKSHKIEASKYSAN